MKDTAVDAAVKGLERAIDKLLAKRKKRLLKRTNSDTAAAAVQANIDATLQRLKPLLQHIRHLFTELRALLRSLKVGLECLLQQIKQAAADINNATQQQQRPIITVPTLQHMFQFLLRLHDGYILTVSGECRHAADVKRAKRQTKFASRLNMSGDDDTEETNTNSNLYAAQHTYSGASWDEWNDARAGVRSRLLRMLVSKKSGDPEQVWESMVDGGSAAGMEALVCETETSMTEIQSQFTRVKAAVTGLCARGQAASSTVHLQWQDKMEQLHYTSKATGKVRLERYASDFKLAGRVLPVEWTTPVQWNENVPWPSTTLQNASAVVKMQEKTKRKRKVICESSEEEEEDAKPAAKKTPAAAAAAAKIRPSAVVDTAGLVVKVVVEQKQEKVSSSVNEIKQQLGVNVKGLEAAFEGITAEEEAATESADAVDEAVQELYEIQQATASVKSNKRALRSLLLSATDYEEIWNAREILRESSMRAGDIILWSEYTKASDQTRKLLQAAVQYFKEARGLVLAQQKLHALMNSNFNHNNSDDMTEDARFYRRNLLLLKGQAQTNAGIAFAELALQYDERDPVRKIQLQAAIKEFDGAVESAHAMKATCTQDAKQGCSSTETSLDSWKALALESLALRWKGVALWHVYQKEASVQSFTTAASVGATAQPRQLVSDESNINDAMLECRTEAYYAWTTLADLASRSMERGTVTLIRESSAFYEKLLQYVTLALTKASSASEALQRTCSSSQQYEQLCAEKDILRTEELVQSLKDISEWWRRRKEVASRPIVDASSKPAPQILTRSDVTQNGPEALPTQRFIARNRSTRRSKYNLGGTGYSNIGNSVKNTTPVVTPRAAPKQYRKWREDMVLDVPTGKLVPKLAYPSLPPEMPPHISAILAARKQASRGVSA